MREKQLILIPKDSERKSKNILWSEALKWADTDNEGLKRIIVCTNSHMVARRNYVSVGFRLYDRKSNETESAYTGDYLYFEIVL